MSKDIIANIKYKELFIPTLLIAMALNVASVVDTMFIASFIGESAVSAIELLEPIVLIVAILEFIFGIGGQILSLNHKAEFDEEGSNKYFTLSVAATLIISLILSAVFLAGKGAIFHILYPPADAMPYMEQYATFLFLSFPLSATLGVLCEFIRVDGQPNFASALIIIANAINILMDYVLIVIFHMGVRGAAIAMFIGYSIGLIFYLKYHFDSKRTYHYVLSKMHVRESLKGFIRISKVGFPDASSTVYEIILIYIFNRLLSVYLGSIGLTCYALCMDMLLILSIIIMGLIETFSTVIPVYYTQHDYENIRILYRKTMKYSLGVAALFTIIMLVAPDLFLMFYNFNSSPNAPMFRYVLRLFSTTFLPSVFSTLYILYYESIERSLVSSILSAIGMIIGPLLAVGLFFPVLGIDSIWISFAFGQILIIITAFISVKVIEKKQPKYRGMLLFEKDLIERTENFNLNSKSDESDVISHLKSLKADETRCKDVESIINYIFDNNDEEVIVEVLVIDYEDNININIKDTGKSDLFENMKKDLSYSEKLKSIEVLGLNNYEYTISK